MPAVSPLPAVLRFFNSRTALSLNIQMPISVR